MVRSRFVGEVAGETAIPAVSSSVKVSVAPVTVIGRPVRRGRPFAAVAVTVTAASAASTSLSTPDTVAVSVALVVAPAAMVTMVASDPTA